jgi:hypothetical protein
MNMSADVLGRIVRSRPRAAAPLGEVPTDFANALAAGHR